MLSLSVEKPKLVLCFTAYCKIVSANKRRLYDDTLYQQEAQLLLGDRATRKHAKDS